MIRQILSLLRKQREMIAYLVIGVMTTAINTIIFMAFPETFYGFSVGISAFIANTVAFFVAVTFAYFGNTIVVFRDKCTVRNFSYFWGMRIGTIFIDNGGMWLLLSVGCDKLIAKCAVNAAIIVLNYLFSKFIIFRKEKKH